MSLGARHVCSVAQRELAPSGTHSNAPSQFNNPSLAATSNNVAEQEKRKGRQKAENKILRKHFKRGGQKPRIEIPFGKLTPLGDWSQRWITEIGILCRKHIPLTAHSWKEVDSNSRKNPLHTHFGHVMRVGNDYLNVRFRDYRHELHMHYLGIAEGLDKREHPAEDVSQQDWESLCCWFEDEKFLKRCQVNKSYRKKNKVNHCGGSKSFPRHRHDQRNPETNEEPTRVEFYRNMHYNEQKGWIHPQAQANYEKMVHIRLQPLQDGSVAPTDDEIVDSILGIKSGYVRGLGRCEVAPSRRDLADNHAEGLCNSVGGRRKQNCIFKS